MPFEDFYKKEDERNRRWWKCVGAAFLLYLGYWSFALLLAPTTKTVEEISAVESRIPNPSDEVTVRSWVDEKRRKRVEETCETLPKPEKFNYLRKEILVENDDLTLITYLFESKRSKDEIMPSFIVWLTANGWKTFSDSKTIFVKDNQTISFQSNLKETANYEILCSEKMNGESVEISFGIYD